MKSKGTDEREGEERRGDVYGGGSGWFRNCKIISNKVMMETEFWRMVFILPTYIF